MERLKRSIVTRLQSIGCYNFRAIRAILSRAESQSMTVQFPETSTWEFFKQYFEELEVERLVDPELVNDLARQPGYDIRKAMIEIAVERALMLLEAELETGVQL